MMEQGSVRNLEQIQESDGERTPRGVTILLVALGGACIVFAGLAIGGRRSAPTAAKVDPLGELVTQQAKIAQGGGGTPAPKATDLSTHDVTFPGILSDEGSPTTALAAVKGGAPKPPTTGAPGTVVPRALSASVPRPPRSRRRPYRPCRPSRWCLSRPSRRPTPAARSCSTCTAPIRTPAHPAITSR